MPPSLEVIISLNRQHEGLSGSLIEHTPVAQRLGTCYEEAWCAVEKYGPIRGGWVYTLGYIGTWWLIRWQLYRKKIFLRV
ncbi:MAG: hypothetical protein ACYDBB_03080 [Armatimonadota bacterium]